MIYDHSDRACELFAGGLNCSQAVFTAFSDVTGIDEETSKLLSSSFGGGMGRMREVCGACSGMFMVLGMLFGKDIDKDDRLKAEHYRRVQQLAGKFRDIHKTINCMELLKGLSVTKDPVPEERTETYYKVRPCVRFVRTAAELLDKYLNENYTPESA